MPFQCHWNSLEAATWEPQAVPRPGSLSLGLGLGPLPGSLSLSPGDACAQAQAAHFFLHEAMSVLKAFKSFLNAFERPSKHL